VTVAAPVKGVEIMPHMGKKGATARLTLDEVDVNQYDAFMLPGGMGPGNLEKFPRALEICRQFMSSGKIVGTLCHGPRLLMRAGARPAVMTDAKLITAKGASAVPQVLRMLDGMAK
jgi:putative intracellular protease/amidase